MDLVQYNFVQKLTAQQSTIEAKAETPIRALSWFARCVVVVIVGAMGVSLFGSTGAGAAIELNKGVAQTSGTGTNFRVGVRHSASSQNWGRACSATAQVWVQEIRKSGVTRFKTRWELRGYYDTGILPTYGSKGWWHSGSFRNDHRSFVIDFKLPYGYLNFGTGKQYSLWAKSVGERPSWWQRDIARRVRTGYVACESSVGMTPGET